MGQFSLENLFGMTIRESANDGSDFTNPDADYRRLFLGEDGQLHVKDSAGSVTDIGGAAGGVSVAVIRDQQTSGTAGGTFTSGSWQTRVLNTEQSDSDGIVTISSNQFTPISGTYLIQASAPSYQVARNKLRLQNVTAATTTIVGENAFAPTTGNGTSIAVLDGVFTANGTDAYELQHQCETTSSTNGLGLACSFTSTVEVFASVTLTKIG